MVLHRNQFASDCGDTVIGFSTVHYSIYLTSVQYFRTVFQKHHIFGLHVSDRPIVCLGESQITLEPKEPNGRIAGLDGCE